MEEEDYKVVEAMEKYGGSFVKSLAQCFHHADPINNFKLKMTFPEYWNEYEKMSKEPNKKDKYYYSGKHTATAKRASLDLSRVLSELRKGDK